MLAPAATAPAGAALPPRRFRPMTTVEFRRWRAVRGYTDPWQAVADLATPPSSLSNVASGRIAVPAAVDRLCCLIELVDAVAKVNPRTLPPTLPDRDIVAEARRLLAVWEMPPPPWASRKPEGAPQDTHRDWYDRRLDRLCALAAFIRVVSSDCRSPALADLRGRAAEMVAGWTT